MAKEYVTVDQCQFTHKPGKCLGKCLVHKRYGASGRDKGKLVELVCACANEAHTQAAKNPNVETMDLFEIEL